MKVGKMDEKYLSLMEVSRRINFSYNTVYKWVKDGKLKSYSFNGGFRVLEKDLDDFIKESKGVNVKVVAK